MKIVVEVVAPEGWDERQCMKSMRVLVLSLIRKPSLIKRLILPQINCGDSATLDYKSPKMALQIIS
jgi:hypothetical protein